MLGHVTLARDHWRCVISSDVSSSHFVMIITKYKPAFQCVHFQL